MSNEPTFNGKEYSWKDVKFFMNGKEVTGIKSFDFKDGEIELGKIDRKTGKVEISKDIKKFGL